MQEKGASPGRTLRVVAVLLVLTGLGTAAFWVAFFADYEAQQVGYLAQRCAGWFLWERSFPLADGWAALACVLGGVGLWRRRAWGAAWAWVAAGALVFLGLMDFLFFAQNGLYWPVTAEVALEAAIHLWVTGFGLATLFLVWRHRAALGL
jgi:hypothetical protein